MQTKKIVIAGFGETGLLVAVNLSHLKSIEITGITPKGSLISGQELGARLTKPEQWKKNYLTDFNDYKKLKNVDVKHGLVKHINPNDKIVTVLGENDQEDVLTYDILVIASGVSNGFWRQVNFNDKAAMEREITGSYETFKQAQTIAVVGGGASGVSSAFNLAEAYPNKTINLYYSQDMPLPGYHPKVRQQVLEKLQASTLNLFPNHRALLSPDLNTYEIGHGEIAWSTGQANTTADAILWAVGQQRPNSAFLPAEFLNDQGYVKVDEYLRVEGYTNVFAVGDIAASDPYRSSARNWGYRIVAQNIQAVLNDQPDRLKKYQPTDYRWGSILGVESDGLTVYQANGGKFKFPAWSIDRILFPIFVRKLMYKGIKKTS